LEAIPEGIQMEQEWKKREKEREEREL